MTEPTSTHPIPSAVPWTPDMMTPQTPTPAPVQTPAPAQPQIQPTPMQPLPVDQAPVHQAPAHQVPVHQTPPQPNYAQTPAPQYQPQAPHPQPAFAPQATGPAPHTQAPQHLVPQMTQPQMQPAQYASTGYQAQPMAPHPAQQQHLQAASMPQYQQAVMPPPLAPHLQVQPQAHQQMAGSVPAANHEPKSFLAKLLKRSPRPQTADVDIQKAAISSGSLFNKNFAIGAVTGLLAGAFVLPMIVNMFGGGKAVAAQTQAQLSVPAVINTAPAAPTSGETFIDAALAADAP